MTRTVEFETELTGGGVMELPPEIASMLPTSGKATVIVSVNMDPDDVAWQRDAYEQFLADDSDEDASYVRYL